MSTMVINIISAGVANRYSMHKYNFCNKLNNTVLSFKMFLTSALELNYLELSKFTICWCIIRYIHHPHIILP